MSRLSIALDTNLITKREHGRLMKVLLREQMVHHVTQVLPRHFEYGATARYGYAQRNIKYMIRKARLVGHRIPLVLTGETRRTILGNVDRITATQNRATWRARNYFPMRTEMRREIEITTPQEERELAARLHARYAELVVTPDYARKRRLRNSAGRFI